MRTLSYTFCLQATYGRTAEERKNVKVQYKREIAKRQSRFVCQLLKKCESLFTEVTLLPLLKTRDRV